VRFLHRWRCRLARRHKDEQRHFHHIVNEDLRPSFHSTTRKGKLTFSQAAAHVEDWQTLFPVVAATPGSLRLAMRAVEQHGLAFWDAMQWAVAKQAGATLLLSEDLQHDRELDGVRFRNPFLTDDPFADSAAGR